MNVAKQLYQLQEVDLELESAEQAVSQIASQLGESQAVLRAQNELRLEQQHLEELKHQQRSAEWEIDDLVGKLSTLEKELYSGKIKNPKELTSLQHEIEGLKAKRNQLEDKALEIMSQVELTEAGIAARRSELEGLEAEWRSQQQRMSDEMKRLESLVSELKHKRDLLVANIDPGTVEFYSELRRQKGTAVARVEQGICRGCRISLPTTDLQQVKGGSLVQCGSCGRILFLP